MEFEWDAAKARSNEAKHGITFAEAIAVFADRDLVVLNVTRDIDGEPRFKAVGHIEGRLFAVVHTVRGKVTRIISARRANRHEERIHDNR